MGTAIPVDAASAGTLSQARAQALSSLKESMPGYSPLAGAKAAPAQPAGAQNPDLAALGASAAPPPTDDAIEGNEGMIPGIPQAGDPTPQAVSKNTEDNGEVGYTSAMHFLRDTFKGTGAEVGNAIPRAMAKLGGWLTNATAGAVFTGEGVFHSSKHYEDAVFDFKKNHIDTAVDYWTPERSQQTGDSQGSGGAAQAIGSGAEMIPGIATGGGGFLAQVLQSGTDSAMSDVDQGKSVKQAVADGTIDGIASWIGAKFGVIANKSILQRVIRSIPANDLIHMAGNILKAGANHAFGDPSAPTPDLFEGLDEATVQGLVFGALGGHHESGADKGKANAGSVDSQSAPGPSPEAVATAAPQPAAQPAVAPVPEGTSPPAASAVPDKPSVEPLKDIKAQFADMNNKTTPRTGVLVTPETQTHITALGDKTVEQAIKQGRTVDLPQGQLVLKTKGDVIKVNQRLKAGEDPQAIIGSVTGAGSGKAPDQTAVVQGRDQSGAVAIESAVHPTDVPLAVQKVEDQGKQAVVTTPAEAVARRVDERNKEAEAQPAAPGTGAKTEAMPEPDVPVESPAAPAPRMGLFKSGSGKDVPVHIEDGAPEGQLRVRPIDTSTGEAAGKTIDVPAARVRQSGADEAEPVVSKPEELKPRETEAQRGVELASEPAVGPETLSAHTAINPRETSSERTVREAEVQAEPQAPSEQAPPDMVREPVKGDEETTARKPQTALEALPAALTAHEKQEIPVDGKKFAGSLAERQDNASAFAAVLTKAADESKGKAPDAAVARAVLAAKRGINLTLKSKNATDKGQGTSHTTIGAIVAEMHKAARVLLGKAKPDDEAVVAPKAAEIKRKISLRKAAAEKPAEPAKEPVVKVVKKKAGLSTAEQAKTNKYIAEFNDADPNWFPAAHERLLKHLHSLADVHGDDFPRDKIDTYMRFLTEQRDEEREAEGRNTGRMSDTIEDEEQEFERPKEGFTNTYRPQIEEGAGSRVRTVEARKRLSQEWQQLTTKLENDGFFSAMSKWRDNGQPLGSHFLIGKMIEHADTPILRTLLTNIRARIPDAPVYNRSEMIDLMDGQRIGKSAGLFRGAHSTMGIQFDFNEAGKYTNPFMVKGLVHEMVHAGTMYEIENNPGGEFAKNIQSALDILRQRLASKYGQEAIDAHTDYFADRGGKVQKPEDFQRQLYGMTNVHELMAEVLTNPDFVKEIAESEDFKSPREKELGVKDGILTRIFRAVGEFFGFKDARLLQHIVDTTFGVMDSQNQRYPEFLKKSSAEYHAKLPDSIKAELGGPIDELMATHAYARIMDEQPPKLRGTDKPLSVITEGSDATNTAREFVHVFKSRAADGLRRSVIAFKTVGQLYRDHLKDFGHDDGTNPLRRVQESDMKKNEIIAKLREISAPVAKKWQRLSKQDDLAVSQLMIDSTMYKLDPRHVFADQSLVARSGKGAEARHAEYIQRYNKLSPEAREVYSDATEANTKLIRAQRRAGVDTAIDALDANLTDAQRGLLYGARTPKVYDSIIGKGKLVDIGENNDKLKSALSDFAGFTEADGPYHHLGRQGDYVVAAEPEGTREFDSRAAAEDFAKRVSDLSPGSSGKTVERGGKFAVDYKAQYVSMHPTRREAELDRDRMSAAGLDVGLVTQKTMNGDNAPLTHGMKELVTEAERKIQKNGSDSGTEAMVASLRSAFLQMVAARSAYAGSRLARKNIGGVKAEDMRRDFAEHALSAGWHTAQMQTVFERAEAMAKVRNMARDRGSPDGQDAVYRRGKVVEALNKHSLDEVQSFGHKAPFNAMMAKLGFMTYLASPSHAAIWMTQNFTTGIPVAGARWGYGKAFSSFSRAMAAVTSPAMRATTKAVFSRGGTSEDIHHAVLEVVRKHPTFGKWAQGENSHLQQLIDRGILSHGYADELGTAAQGKSARVERVFEWARLLPAMADSFNRVSTALAGLEMTGGDIRKTGDFVQEIHADYSAANKPLAFKRLNRIPGASSITMFKTYAQEMIHLTYGNLVGTMKGEDKAEAGKTLAGLIVGNALFAGVYGAIALEPLKLAMYAYHKVADDEGEVWDFKNAVHRFLVDHFGKDVGNSLAGGPIPRLLNADLSSRMGLADLFFHNPPDLLSADKDEWKNFIYDQMGPMVQDAANNVTGFMGKMQRGDTFGAVSSIIPVKQWQDAAKALQLMNEGKQDSLGGHLTHASTGDAITQLLGFKPKSVADAQEKQGVRIDYAITAKKTKDDIVKQYVASKPSSLDRVRAVARLNTWNKNNPTVPITSRDISKMAHAQAMTEAGAPDRNQKANEATNF